MKYLALIFLVIPSIANANEWKHFYNKDPITDFVQEYAYISSTEITPAEEKITTTISIGCGGYGPYVSFEFSKRTIEMTYRIDDQQPIVITEFVNFYPIHSVLFKDEDGRELIENIKGGKSVVLRRQETLTALTQTTHYFDINKKSRMIKKVLEACY